MITTLKWKLIIMLNPSISTAQLKTHGRIAVSITDSSMIVITRYINKLLISAGRSLED